MKVFIMRHGEASIEAGCDAQRVLTESGKKHSIQTAQWLDTQMTCRVSKVLVSPYLRAQQTLNAVLTVLVVEEVETISQLTPSGNEAQVADYLWVLAAQGVATVLIVSHLPLVGYLVTELCPDVHPPMFATSAAVSMDLDPDSGLATVDCYYHP